jgi:hypothetical protein
MQLLRPLAGYSLLEQKRNKDIRHELDIPPIIEILVKYRMVWHDHLQRTSINLIPKRLLNYRPTGVRSKGCPRRRWIDQFEICRRNRPEGIIREVFDDDEKFSTVKEKIPEIIRLLQSKFSKIR